MGRRSSTFAGGAYEKLSPLLVFVLLIGPVSMACGGGSSSTASCANPAGLYEYVYTQRASGLPPFDCAAIASVERVIPQPTSSDCHVVAENESPDNCSASVEETCSANGMSVESIATVDGNTDASRLTGTLATTQTDATGNVVCHGSYTFVATKLHN